MKWQTQQIVATHTKAKDKAKHKDASTPDKLQERKQEKEENKNGKEEREMYTNTSYISLKH